MAVDVAVGAGREEVDLGGESQLGGLDALWRVDVDGVVWESDDEDVSVVEVETELIIPNLINI